MRNAASPVFRVAAGNVHRIRIGTLIDAGPHQHQPDFGIQSDTFAYGFEVACGMPFSVVEPVNDPARRLLTLFRAPRPRTRPLPVSPVAGRAPNPSTAQLRGE